MGPGSSCPRRRIIIEGWRSERRHTRLQGDRTSLFLLVRASSLRSWVSLRQDRLSRINADSQWGAVRIDEFGIAASPGRPHAAAVSTTCTRAHDGLQTP